MEAKKGRNAARVAREALGAETMIVIFQREKGGEICVASAGLDGTELVGVLEIGKRALIDQAVFSGATITNGPNGA